MTYALSPELDRIVREKVSTGRYTSEEDVIRAALRLLNEFEDSVAAVAEGREDVKAGRRRPFFEADADFRAKNGIAKSE